MAKTRAPRPSNATAGYASLAAVKVERLRLKLSTTCNQSKTGGKRFSYPTPKQVAAGTMSRFTAEGRAQSNNNGPSI